MLKKYIYIFTAFCLLNTIFCFHVGDLPAPGSGNPGLAESDAYTGGGTLLDFLLGQLQDDSSDNENKTPLKIKCRHNHGYFRTVSVNVQAPELQASAYDAPTLPCQDRVPYGNYQLCKASLPSYYSFLFRLNLF
jgi:hypothetical protein